MVQYLAKWTNCNHCNRRRYDKDKNFVLSNNCSKMVAEQMSKFNEEFHSWLYQSNGKDGIVFCVLIVL